MKSCIIRILMLILLAAGPARLAAEDDMSTASDLKLANIFTDHMVLEKDIDIPIWGEDTSGNKLTISIDGQKLKATADKNGKWKVIASPLKGKGPFQLEVESESGKLTIKDILCGEVWIFTGDAVLGRQLGKSSGAKLSSTEADQIRIFNEPRQFAKLPYDEILAKWEICNPDLNDKIPAVPYYFARDLMAKTNLPVGIIMCSVPGSVSEAWISREGITPIKELAFLADYQELVQNFEGKISGTYRSLNALSNLNAENFSTRYSGAVKKLQLWAATDEGKNNFKSEAELERWQDKIQDWVDLSLRCEAQGAPVSEEQKSWPLFIQAASGIMADPRTSPTRPSALFNGMINPIIPYAVKGVVLWHGETDAGWERGDSYFNIDTSLMRNWRGLWNKGQGTKKSDLSFVVVQLQDLKGKEGLSADECFKIRAAQASVPGKLGNTSTVVTTDLPLGDDGSISPEGLKEAGQRIALSALGKFYNQKVVYSGPVFESIASVGGQIMVKFKFDDNGLIAGKDGKAGKVIGFETANSDKKFEKAEAEIGKDSILINNTGDILAVRYGWGENSGANLYNKEGLPTSPFIANLPEKKQ